MHISYLGSGVVLIAVPPSPFLFFTIAGGAIDLFTISGRDVVAILLPSTNLPLCVGVTISISSFVISLEFLINMSIPTPSSLRLYSRARYHVN